MSKDSREILPAGGSEIGQKFGRNFTHSFSLNIDSKTIDMIGPHADETWENV